MNLCRPILAATALSIVASCSQIAVPAFLQRSDDRGSAPLDATAQPGAAVPGAAAPSPSANARTAEDFDTTTPEQRAAATVAKPEGASETRLGDTVASLGDPTQAGFWIKSPLVKAAGPGRLENPSNGKSAKVELIPLDGAAGAGSQVSLAALRLLEAPITDLPTLVVYAE